MRVLVVGAGVSGFTTAVRLAEMRMDVSIVAAAFSPHTTSDVAAAVWFPFRMGGGERARRWAMRTYDALALLAPDPATGVRVVDGIEVAAAPERPWWSKGVEGFRPARSHELPAGHGRGWVFRAPVAAMPTYMGWLRTRAEALGVRMHQEEVDDLTLVQGEADVVVNCTGLGARRLTGDTSLTPIQGQIVRVAAGHAPRFVQATRGPGPPTYVIPRPDCTILGGTAVDGAWDTTPDPAVAQSILDRCCRLEPGLTQARVESHAVGLRPGRPTVRVEAEPTNAGLVVHNYGHGGAGVTVSWGCAEEVGSLIRKLLPRP